MHEATPLRPRIDFPPNEHKKYTPQAPTPPTGGHEATPLRPRIDFPPNEYKKTVSEETVY